MDGHTPNKKLSSSTNKYNHILTDLLHGLTEMHDGKHGVQMFGREVGIYQLVLNSQEMEKA